MSNIGNHTDEQVRADFQLLEGQLNGQRGGFVHQARQEALDLFLEQGYPSSRHEEWKYTNIHRFLDDDVSLVFKDKGENAQISGLNTYADHEGHKLVFVNGYFRPELSHILEEDAGIIIGSLNEAISGDNSIGEEYYNRLARNHEEPFTALNTAFNRDGLFLHIPKGAELRLPVYVINAYDSEIGHFVYPRNLVIAKAGSRAKIVEDYQNLSGNTFFCNAFGEYFLSRDAHVEVCSIQNEPDGFHFIGTKEVEQDENSCFDNTSVALSGKLIRNNIHLAYKGKHCDCHLNGLYFARDKDLIDNRLLVDHQVPSCVSNQLYKGILDDEGTGIFNGKIFVQQDAQQTDAYQSNKNLLLSDKATINSKPQLEIFADDVRCSHGATSGQLDDQAMFYLMARGIPKERARSLLIYAFAGDVTQRITIEPMRAHLENLLKDQLGLDY